MLVNKSGFRIFNEYDLVATLDGQLSNIRHDIEAEIKSSSSDVDANINRYLERYTIQPLLFDQNGMTVSTREEMIPAEYFGNEFFVEPGERYSKEVYSFHLPFTGDKSLLRCVASTRILWTEEVLLENNEIIFDVINFSNNAEQIKAEKDRILKYLVEQAGHVNSQVNQYNANLEKVVQDAIGNTVQKMTQQSALISKLGVPLKSAYVASPAYQARKVPDSSVVNKKSKEFDVFICHASEDKPFVKQLAEALTKGGIEVWYDDFQLGWGDDLRPAIDNGLKSSRYGLVILSKAFLGRKTWTEYELNGLFAKEKNFGKVVLPIWHNIKRDDIAKYSLSLADRLAKSSSSIEEIVLEMKKLLKK